MGNILIATVDESEKFVDPVIVQIICCEGFNKGMSGKNVGEAVQTTLPYSETTLPLSEKTDYHSKDFFFSSL